MGLLTDLVVSTRYRELDIRLPTDETIRSTEHGFEFALPWPWFETSSEHGAPAGASSIICELAAPRTTDPWPSGVFFSEASGSPIDDKTVKSESRQVARSRSARPNKPRRLRLGGLSAIDFVSEDGSFRYHDLSVPVEESLTIRAEFWLPIRHAEGYELHMDSMLSSWRWFR